jgi:hypothetical protein
MRGVSTTIGETGGIIEEVVATLAGSIDKSG